MKAKGGNVSLSTVRTWFDIFLASPPSPPQPPWLTILLHSVSKRIRTKGNIPGGCVLRRVTCAPSARNKQGWFCKPKSTSCNVPETWVTSLTQMQCLPTFCVDCRDIGPIVTFDYVKHSPGLQSVRGYDPQEVFVQSFVTQVDTCGRISDLGDVKELEQVLHLDGYRAGAWADHTCDGLLSPACRERLAIRHTPVEPILLIPNGN